MDYDTLMISDAVLELPDGKHVELPACRLNELDAVVAEAIRVNSEN